MALLADTVISAVLSQEPSYGDSNPSMTVVIIVKSHLVPSFMEWLMN